jgi:alpha-L-fucosidase
MQPVRQNSAGDKCSAKYINDYFPLKFTYQDFGPMLTMNFFNAKKIADLVAGSGAKYFVFTSKHHDGYCNWPSSYSYGWNSMDVGPKRDVVGELQQERRIK